MTIQVKPHVEASKCVPKDALITLKVQSRTQRDQQLDFAVARLLEQAVEAGAGILVTRNDPWTFTVEINKEISPGTIRELDRI